MKETHGEMIRFLVDVIHSQNRRFTKRNDKINADTSILRMMAHHFPDGAKPSEIANHNRASLPSISQKLSNLENDGYITRQYSKEDKRVTIINLTDKADKFLQEQYKETVKVYNEALNEFSKKEKKELIFLLEKFSDSLEELIKKEGI